MERRSFLSLLGLAGLGTLFTACAVTVDGSEPADDASAPTDGASTADAPRVPLTDAAADTRVAVDTAAGGVVIAESFEVILNDSTCSGHSHSLVVHAGTYPDGVLVRYLGGSHLVALLPSELALLERGARLPFATVGNGPGHGHCGTAWRTSVGPEEPHRPDACALHNTTAVCSLHPRG